MKFEKQIAGACYLKDYSLPGPLPEGLEATVTLHGRINSRGNFVATLPENSETSHISWGGRKPTVGISIRWRELFELPTEDVLVTDNGPGLGSLRLDRHGMLWSNDGHERWPWVRLTPRTRPAGEIGAAASRLTWADLVAERGPMRSIPEEIGGAR